MQKIPTNLFSFLKLYTLRYSRWSFSLVLLMMFLGMVPAIDSFLIKNIIDSVEQGASLSGDELFHSLLKWIIIYTIWWEGLNWSWRLYDYLYLKFIPQAKITIIDNLFNLISFIKSRRTYRVGIRRVDL